ncbi:MAG: dynamin family protein, partial [Thermoplasmatota archaeon]
MGQFNAGKSTLLNAMLRTDVLPTKIFPSTAILTFIRCGEAPKATIFFPRSKEPRSLTVEDFNAAYCLKPGEPEALKSQRFAEVDHAVVEYPIPLCRHGVELVDSPGLNEVEHREKITLDYLHEADAVIFVFHASSFWTDCERRYLDDHVLPAGLDHIFFLVNWWDLVEGNPESAADLWARTRAKLTPYCQLDGKNLFDQRVFRLSAENARIARQRDDQVLLEKSGLPTFEERLADFILRGRGAAILRRALRHAEIASREADDAVELRLAAYEEEVGELEKRLGEIQPKFEQLRELRKQIAARIDSRCQRERDRDEWFFDTELLLSAERRGNRIAEVPVDWIEDPRPQEIEVLEEMG